MTSQEPIHKEPIHKVGKVESFVQISLVVTIIFFCTALLCAVPLSLFFPRLSLFSGNQPLNISGSYQGEYNDTTAGTQDEMTIVMTQAHETLGGQLQLVEDTGAQSNFSLTGTVTQTTPIQVSFVSVSVDHKTTLTFTGQYDKTSGKLSGDVASSQGYAGTWTAELTSGDSGD